VPATVIVGAQWGDEGKGKIVDLLAQHSDLVCRYQCGPNAGHTIVADGQTYKFRHMPSGILWGKECVLGAGCVVDPAVFIEELDDLEARGLSTEQVHPTETSTTTTRPTSRESRRSTWRSTETDRRGPRRSRS
jgi:adenylosuccinate synthase